MSRLQERKGEEGFTLIELLVVIIIIGILAAIAIPVFLNQRQNAWNAAVESDLRNAATAQETVLVDTGAYTEAEADLTGAGFEYSDDANYQGGAATITATADAGNAYCLVATSASGTTYYYSSAGGFVDNDCTIGAP